MRWLMLLVIPSLASPLFGADLAPTPVATAGMTDAPPSIDGRLDDGCWTESSAILRGFVQTDMSAFAPVDTDARVCWGAEKLYVGVRCEEPNVDALRAQMTERDDAVWRDDCIELFLDTNHDRKTYAHVIVSSIGTIYDDRIPGDASWDADIDVAAQTGDGLWAVEVAIGLESLGGAPQPGDVWGFNVGRERYAGEGQLSIWSPTYAKFLEPDRFGELLFAEEPGGFAWALIDQPMFGLCEIGLFGDRDVQPGMQLMREWPEGLKRDWPTPAPEVVARTEVQAPVQGLEAEWTGRYRIVDGSEAAVVVEQTVGDATIFRQAIPISITPEPKTAALAQQVLALAGRAERLADLAEDLRALLDEAAAAIEEFVQANLERTEPISEQQWAEAAGRQEALLGRISGLSYVVWTQSPLLDLDRDQMPPSLQPDPTIVMTACGNEVECGDFIVTNLSEDLFEGRVTVSELKMTSAEALEETDAENLLQNADFSRDADEDGVPDGWTANVTNGSWALVEQPDGSKAFVLSGQAETSVNFRQTLDLEAGEQYTLVSEMSCQDLLGGGHTHIINNGWTWSKTLTPLPPTSPRTEYATSFTAPESEHFQVVLRLDTDSGGTVRFHRVRLVRGGVEEITFEPGCITMHQAEYQDLRTGKTVADPLPAMNEARTLRVGPGESRQVFLTVDTATLPPGDFMATIRLQPFDRSKPHKVVPLRLRVLPVRLPELMPVNVYNWDYARNERYVADLAAHETNTFLMSTGPRMRFEDDGTPRGEVDWASYDEMLQVKLRYARERGGIVMFSYGIVRDFHRVMSGRHGWEFMSEPWKRAFKAWVLEFERHMRDDMGMGYEGYAVQLWDEATHENAEMTAEAGHFIREFAPNMRLCMDGAQDPDEVRMLDPVIDVWIPHQSALLRRAHSEELRDLYAQLMERGEPVWTYTCSTNMKALSPLDYYRLKEWRVWDLGVQGSCFWAYNSWRGDPWNDFDGNIADCGTIYDGPGRPITSRRWEATRDGREDYKALHLLREAARAQGGEAQRRVEALIDSLVAEVLANPTDLEVFGASRGRLLAVLERHCGSDPPELTGAVSFEAVAAGVRCTWATDRPAEGVLFYRVPGDAQWRSADFEMAKAHEATLTDLPDRRSGEWYLIWWDGRGATGFDASGLRSEGWFSTER